MSAEIQFRTARIDNSDHNIDIKTVRREFQENGTYRREHQFHCPCCGKEMMAVLGLVREDHFRHKGEPCGYNNYLHSTAEDVFFDEYTHCLNKGLPFIITVFPEIQCNPACTLAQKDSCSKRHKDKTEIDLTRKFKRIKPEVRVFQDGRYRRPDLLLESESGEILMVEIWVSHETDAEKRKQGNILEIKISSEEDIEKIRTHRLTQTGPTDKSIRLFVWGEVCSNHELTVVQKEDNRFRPVGKLVGERKPSHSRPRILPHTNHHSNKWVRPPVELNYPAEISSLKLLPARGEIPYWKRKEDPIWIDLGLPSGTLWSSEYMGSMSFEEVQREFQQMIPSIEQYQELATNCRTTGPLPAGFIGPNDAILIMNEGDFWTRLSLNEAQALVFHKEDVIDEAYRDKPPLLQGLGFVKADKEMRLSVRLVKKVR